MSISWDKLEIGACYERNGEYLGEFIKRDGNPATQSREGFSFGNLWGDDSILKFENKDIYLIEGMKFNKVECDNRTFPGLAVHQSSPATKTHFNVEVLNNANGDKIYKCPHCKMETGTAAPKYPTDTSFFSHKRDCPNKGKIPMEPTGGRRIKYKTRQSMRKNKRNTKKNKRKRRKY